MKRLTFLTFIILCLGLFASALPPKAWAAGCTVRASSSQVEFGKTLILKVTGDIKSTYKMRVFDYTGGTNRVVSSSLPRISSTPQEIQFGFTANDTTGTFQYSFEVDDGALQDICMDNPIVTFTVTDPILTPTPSPNTPAPSSYTAKLCSSGIEGVDTAIGCVPTGDYQEFLKYVLRFAFGIAGGLIVLMLIKVGYDILTSQGDPNKLAAVKQTIISILSGLIMIVFSMVLLRTIGVDILGLPGFS